LTLAIISRWYWQSNSTSFYIPNPFLFPYKLIIT
jgi:hypothetical protein